MIRFIFGLYSAMMVSLAMAGDNFVVESSFKMWPLEGGRVPDTQLSAYKLELLPGSQQLMARYPTFSGHYDCLFKWTALAGEVYEITDMNQAQPLTLFRLESVGTMYQRRHAALLPFECILKKGGD